MKCRACHTAEATASFTLYRGNTDQVEQTEELCAACWARRERELRRRLGQRDLRWRVLLPVRDWTPERVADILAGEGSMPAEERARVAEAMVHSVIHYRRRLPPELEEFVRRHWRPSA
jgi:hypothetical protein